MKRITIINLIVAVAFVVLLVVLKLAAYNTAVIFGSPNVIYLFLSPIIVTIFIFNATLIILFKANNLHEKMFKWISLVFLILLSISTFSLPWMYIVAGSSLQLFIQIWIIILSVSLGGYTIFVIVKSKN